MEVLATMQGYNGVVAYNGGVGAVVRSLPPDPEIPGSIPGLVEG